jgi:cell division protein FtsI/penicillin-binding protein 2
MVLSSKPSNAAPAVLRMRLWYSCFIAIIVLFGVRLFYVQIIRYDHYKNAALSDQLKQYEIPARRGIIKAHDGDQILPIVLNQKLYTLYADPTYVKNPDDVAQKLGPIVGNNINYAKLLRTKKTRYVVLAKKISEQQSQRILDLKFPGVGTIAQDYRTYPQGSLAAQLLGFVDDSGGGQYGIEQALNNSLKGKPGELRAITDASGVPLAASKNNTQTAPQNGQDQVLTIDLAMQQQLETVLQKGVQDSKAASGSALILDPNTGAVKAMANFPTYDPAHYSGVANAADFQNSAVAKPIEVGSIMKSLTTAAALDQGVINPTTSYYDPSVWKVDGFKITNIEEDGPAGTRNIADILNLSLNTGATWELMQMGGGTINQKGRDAWYDYLTKHFRFGQATGIEQGYEATGYIPAPAENGAGIDLTYANMAFGQALTATPIQMGAALSAVLNGGTYYQPRLIDQTIDPTGQATTIPPKVLAQNVVAPKTSQAMIPLLQNVVVHHTIGPSFDQTKYIVGGKTGTAQIAKPGGGYYDNEFNGSYIGFVGGDKVQYVIVVFVDKPTNGGYAGTAAAQPIFAGLAHMLINDSYVMPKTH